MHRMLRQNIFALGFIFLLLAGFVVVFFKIHPKVKDVTQHNPPIVENDKEDINATLMLGGDVMLGRNVRERALLLDGFSYTTENIKDYTKNSDIFFVNLENPIIENCPNHDGGFVFCAPPEMLLGLKEAGVNVVTLANNHSRNYGGSGLEETEKFLSGSAISAVGLNNLVIKEVNSIKFGFLGFDFTVKSPTKDDYQLIDDSDGKVDFLLVGVHWGEEYKNKANTNQRKWAGEMVSHGADIIVGHHPHWIQDFECLNAAGTEASLSGLCNGVSGKAVYYSLGNLIFDQMWSEETKKGMLVRLEIGKGGIVNREIINTYIEKSGQPKVVGEF